MITSHPPCTQQVVSESMHARALIFGTAPRNLRPTSAPHSYRSMFSPRDCEVPPFCSQQDLRCSCHPDSHRHRKTDTAERERRVPKTTWRVIRVMHTDQASAASRANYSRYSLAARAGKPATQLLVSRDGVYTEVPS